MQFGDLSTIFWTLCLSHMMLSIIVKNKAVDTVEGYRKYYCMFAYGVPVLVAILPVLVSIGREDKVYGDGYLW